METKRRRWEVPASDMSKKTFNPIRSIVDHMKINPNPEKEMIKLSLGDPTIFGNLPPAPEAINALIASIHSDKYNGYSPSIGHEKAWQAVATFCSTPDAPLTATYSRLLQHSVRQLFDNNGHEKARQAVATFCSTPDAPLTAKDVILASGCSHAIQMVIDVLLNPGDNLLIPKPGFSLYQTISLSRDHEVKMYDLLPERSWEVDVDQMESLIDDRTRAIVVINPSNPCGSVYSKQHLQDILAVAERHKIPIIADEIYGHTTFPGHKYYDIPSLTRTVPVLSCGGLAKRFLVPGWRMGWICVHDRGNVLREVLPGLYSLSQQILGPNSLLQGALPDILSNTPQEFFEKTNKVLHTNAKLFFEEFSKIPVLRPIMPCGAMYMMVGLDMCKLTDIQDDLDFVEKLISEQSVFCLPAKCFQYPNYFRVVLTLPHEKTKEACHRIAQFCLEHSSTQYMNGMLNGCAEH